MDPDDKGEPDVQEMEEVEESSGRFMITIPLSVPAEGPLQEDRPSPELSEPRMQI